MKRFFPIPFLILLFFIGKTSFGQLSVTNCSALGLTPAQLIQTYLVGPGITVTNAKFNGSSSIITSVELGSFVASGNAMTQMGLDSGLIMTCGQADSAIGPNDNCGAGLANMEPGDADLSALADTNTNDACVLEFDFVPLSDTIRFRYVFASEEFFTFCYRYNDPFGFFLSGPGITGPFSNFSTDIALMPDSSTYVTINNVCGNPSSVWCNGPIICGPDSMCQNSPPNSGEYFQYNALTHVFTAWHAVQPCAVYHIKIAVADAVDYVLDSGVFLEKGSFSSTSVNGPSPVCVNSSGNVYTTQAGMMNYQWTVSSGGIITSGGTSTDNTVAVTWTLAGIQTVSVNYTNAGGCSSPNPATMNVLVNPLPVPSLTGPSDPCVNSPGNIYHTQPGMTNYLWTVSTGGTITAGGTTTSDSVTVTWNVPGIQTVSVNYTDSSNCPGANPATEAVTVHLFSVPVIQGKSSACIFSMGNVYHTQPGMSNYIWVVSPGGLITAGGSTTSDSITITWNSTGIQTISVNYTDTTGCPVQGPTVDTITIFPLPVPVIQGPSSVCIFSKANIYSTEPGMNNYDWVIPAGGTITNGPGTNSITVTWNIPGIQSISLKYSDQHGCMAGSPVTFDVTVDPLPDPAGSISGVSQVCRLTSGLIYSVTEINNASGYFWTLPPGFQVTSGNGTNSIEVDITNDAVSGIISVFGRDSCGNGTASPPFNVNVILPPAAEAGPDRVTCSGIPVLINQATAANYTSIMWGTSGPGILADSNTLTPVYTPGISDTGIVILTLFVTGSPVCPNYSFVIDYLNLYIYPIPVVTAGPDQLIKYDSSTLLTCEPSGGSGKFMYNWEPGSLLMDYSVRNPRTVNLKTDTVFIVTITDTVTGCIATDSIRVKINKTPGTEDCLVIHNVITPNGDGINDKWEIDCIDQYPENKVEIFNQWGDMVRSFENYNNTVIFWEGNNSNGHSLPDGTYFYIIKLKNGATYNGWVLLCSN